MTADQVLAALKKKHADDIFIPECKMGATYAKVGSQQRLDALAVKKTWAPVTLIGYEIKVSRSDFLADNKMRDYIGACTEFYLIVPRVYGGKAQIANRQELPEGAGLLEVLETGTIRRLVKAPVRAIEYKKGFHTLLYALMHRGDAAENNGSTAAIEAEAAKGPVALAYYLSNQAYARRKKVSKLVRQVLDLADVKYKLEQREAALQRNEKHAAASAERVRVAEAALQACGLNAQELGYSGPWQGLAQAVASCVRTDRERMVGLVQSMQRMISDYGAEAKKMQEKLAKVLNLAGAPKVAEAVALVEKTGWSQFDLDATLKQLERQIDHQLGQLIEQPHTITGDNWYFETFISHSGASGGEHLHIDEVRKRLTDKYGAGELLQVDGKWRWKRPAQ